MFTRYIVFIRLLYENYLGFTRFTFTSNYDNFRFPSVINHVIIVEKTYH